MKPERWQQLDQLLEAVLERPPAAHTALPKFAQATRRCAWKYNRALADARVLYRCANVACFDLEALLKT